MDQFYTRDEIAEYCYNIVLNKINLYSVDLFMEPSAGRGSFFKLFPVHIRVGIDLEPKYNGIQEMDFFDYKPDNTYKNICVVGNPPFGRISSLAIKFFNHAASFDNVDVIAFIIPRTFKRVSVQNRLNLNFHLIYNEDLPLKPCCFEPEMSAKCCFQVWQRQDHPRTEVVLDSTHPDFEFLSMGPKDENNQPTPPVGADFALLAYGGQCGRIVHDNLHTLRPKSWHWIRSNIDVDVLIDRFNQLDYSISQDTVRQNSIGRKELIYLYTNL